MTDVVADLAAEQEALESFLGSLGSGDWSRPSFCEGWDVKDVVLHLAHGEEAVVAALSGEEGWLDEWRAHDSFDGAAVALVERDRHLSPEEALVRWRRARQEALRELEAADPRSRVPWFFGELAVQTLATTRLMETWAHHLDIRHPFGTDPEDTTRLRHVAWLGWRALPYAFQGAGADYQPVRLELEGPNGETWIFGPEDTDQVVRGAAGEWCRVAVRRLPASDARTLETEGPVAARALLLARAYG